MRVRRTVLPLANIPYNAFIGEKGERVTVPLLATVSTD